MRHFLVHNGRDNVGVVVTDVTAGQELEGAGLCDSAAFHIKALRDIPLGHKVALKDFKVGDTVIKYGEDIGKVVADIRAGEHVHVHNLKTKRW